ncbi:thioesterase II family protein [Actinacidiphila yeochonensis]|uniref:thioesterase II family protein n=1 Tax=Actinacidiphila yeochonensis TaxID=89050 RepID=UPI000AB278FE|nr:thioesterase domain-containing protein [Actinacidiphila yeochonensis]
MDPVDTLGNNPPASARSGPAATATAPAPDRLPSGATAGTVLTCSMTRPDARLRLVCFPHSGAGPAVFHRWAHPLGREVEVWSATMPGRAARSGEPFATDWAGLTAEFADAVEALVPGPYALFGQSLGSVVAFEVGRELTRRGRPPLHFVSSAGAAPDVRPVFTVPEDDDALIRKVDVHYAGIPAAVKAVPELVAYFLPVLRADLELAASYTYRPGPGLPCPVTAFAGDRDGTVSADGLAAWRRHAGGGFEAYRLPGGHFAFTDHEDRALRTIARRLRGRP